MKKVVKIFAVLSVIILLGCIFVPLITNVSKASDAWSSAPRTTVVTPSPQPSTTYTPTEPNNDPAPSGERGNIPDPEPQPEPTPQPKQTTIVETEQRYVSVQGNVYDVGISENVKDIKVNLLNESGKNVVASCRTDSDGNYNITASPGNYRLQFVMGDIKGIGQNDIYTMKNALKYNGQDYQVVESPFSSGSSFSSTNGLTTPLNGEEIISLKKKAVQVMLCVDYSNTVREKEITTYDGKKRKMIDVEIESTKKLINELLNLDQSIYITLICFDGNNHYRVLDYGLSRDEQKMYTALDKAVATEPIGGTDMVAALDVAKDSFVYEKKEDANRVVAIITDGVPSGCFEAGQEDSFTDQEVILESDDDSARKAKLESEIVPHTKSKLKELKDDGISVISLVTKAEDDPNNENQYIDQIFNDDTTNMHISLDNGTQLVDGIEDILRNSIGRSGTQNSQSPGESFSESSVRTWEIPYGTEEDKKRNIEVAKNFNDDEGFVWSNTKLFQMIDTYSGSNEDYETAKKLSDATKITMTSTNTYKIEDSNLPSDWQSSYVDGDGDTITVIHHYEKASYSASLKLQEKPPAELNLIKYASGLKVTLANNQVLYYKTISYDSNNSNSQKIEPLMAFMDNEIAQGTTVEVEFTIHATSQGATNFNQLRLIDYLPNVWKYDPNAKLLSEDATNSKYWQVQINNDSMKGNAGEKYFNQNSPELENKQKYCNNILSNPMTVKGGETQDFKIVVSMLISNLDDYEEVATQYNEAEVFSYKTSNPISAIAGTEFELGTPRRMKTSQNVRTQDCDSFYLYPASFSGVDYVTSADANIVTVLPPTGIQKSEKMKKLAIKAIVLITTLIIVWLVDKKICEVRRKKGKGRKTNKTSKAKTKK